MIKTGVPQREFSRYFTILTVSKVNVSTFGFNEVKYEI